MTAADERHREDCARARQADFDDICRRLDRDHMRNPSENPTFGMSQAQINHEQAVMAGNASRQESPLAFGTGDAAPITQNA